MRAIASRFAWVGGQRVPAPKIRPHRVWHSVNIDERGVSSMAQPRKPDFRGLYDFALLRKEAADRAAAAELEAAAAEAAAAAGGAAAAAAGDAVSPPTEDKDAAGGDSGPKSPGGG